MTNKNPAGNRPVPAPAEHSHLDACAACRELDALWNELLGPTTPRGEPDEAVTVSTEDLAAGVGAEAAGAQEAAGNGTLLGKRADTPRQGRGGELPEANRCRECGRWKRPQYETCFDCSGMALCSNCGQNYHDSQYEVCYSCGQSRWEEGEWDE